VISVVEVFSLFDVLVHESKPPYFAIVGLFDCSLGEIEEDGQIIRVLGRACGDRLACVSLKECITLKSLFCVSSHELLHTFGLDHCTTFECLMNSIQVDDWLFLSPLNLRKLMHFHLESDEQSNEHSFILKRYSKLLNFFEKMKTSEFSDECKWLERKILAMENTRI
jgi:hypothetical protein